MPQEEAHPVDVPDDGPKGAQPVAHGHQLVALQGGDEEVNIEQQPMNREGKRRADLKVGKSLTIFHPHGHAIVGRGSHVQETSNMSHQMKQWVETKLTRAMRVWSSIDRDNLIEVPDRAWREISASLSTQSSSGCSSSYTSRR
jgi:hypothetical protein